MPQSLSDSNLLILLFGTVATLHSPIVLGFKIRRKLTAVDTDRPVQGYLATDKAS